MNILAGILAVAAVAVIWFVWKSNQKAAKGGQTPSRKSRRAGGEPDVRDLEPGGVFALRGVGDDLADMDVSVIGKHIYDERGFKWFEIEGETGDGKVWLEVIEDDEVELSISLRKFSLVQLGVTKKQLKKFDDKEDGSFTFEDVEYVYEDSGDVVFLRDGDPNAAEEFYYWDFESRDGTRFIGVERWADGTHEVHLSQPLRASQVTVFATKGESQ